VPTELPPPATAAELYLAAILRELRGLRAATEGAQAAAPVDRPAAPVELREPAPRRGR
jgi:hypothetical protein